MTVAATSSIGVDLERDIHESCPGLNAGEVDHPQRVGPADAELQIGLVQRAGCLRVAGRDRFLAPPDACHSHDAH